MARLKRAARRTLLWVPFVAFFVVPAWAGPGGRAVVDGAGRSVAVPARAARIVSLAPSVTEILFAIGAGDRVVGVTDFCDTPAEAAARPRIGGLIHPDTERILSLAPDLAIASTAGNYLDDAERLERLGIPVYAIDTPDVASILDTLETLADLLGEAPEGRRITADLRARIAAVRDRVAEPRPRVLFVIETDPIIVPGPDTFLGEAIALAGGHPASLGSASKWAQYDLEQVLAMAPEVILVTRVHEAWARGLRERDEWRTVPAVVTGRVHVISDAIQHPGPRLIDGIEEVAGLIRSQRGARERPERGREP